MLPTPSDLAQVDTQNQTRAPYFGLGFRHTTLDPSLFQKIADHWSHHKEQFVQEKDIAYIGTTNKNYSPTLFVSDDGFNNELLQDLKPLHEKWSGMKLKEEACYGIRVYQKGSYLYTHVDRPDTHIISSTICVAHYLHTPWPLYIEDIDGTPHKISMEAGDMVFYEGAKLMHGRPYPLDGRFYAGLFVHYSPMNSNPSDLERS